MTISGHPMLATASALWRLMQSAKANDRLGWNGHVAAALRVVFNGQMRNDNFTVRRFLHQPTNGLATQGRG